MKMAFSLFRYFPHGGLSRDFLRIARECVRRGHQVDVYTMKWEGEQEPGITVHVLKPKGLFNHSRREHFAKEFQGYLAKSHYDLVVGFNKMPHLDVYYAADTCYQSKSRNSHGFLYRLTGRYRKTVAFEEAVFSPEAKTEILLIAKKQQAEFQQHYKTADHLFHLLPPGIARDRVATEASASIREETRKENGIHENELVLLMVGSGFKTKGVDRTLAAFAALPENLKQRACVIIIGNDHPGAFLRQAKSLKITEKVTFLGGRDDVPAWLLSADLLMHPAYNENTGTVLLEALVSGLPVLTTDVCGYADYVRDANAGKVVASPFCQEVLNQMLLAMLTSNERPLWRQNGLTFAEHADIYHMPERAVTLIESFG